MAKVTVDISEYDGLRDNLKGAKQTIEELKETIKDLKKGSKVILQTKYVRGNISDALRYIRGRCNNLSYGDYVFIQNILNNFFGGEPRDTFQYINFKDVEAQVKLASLNKRRRSLKIL